MESVKKNPKSAPPPKITRSQIDIMKTTSQKKEKVNEKEGFETHLTIPLEENINRPIIEEEDARSIMEAINILRYLKSYLSHSGTIWD